MSAPKKIRVRIAVATRSNGESFAVGCEKAGVQHTDPEAWLSDAAFLEEVPPNERLACVWVEADVPVPEPSTVPTIEGTVTP